MHRHFLLHKPYGYLSQFVNKGPKQGRKKLLGELYDFPEGTMAIGRLDEDSEGLLLLTTEGKVSEVIRSAKFEKEYLVQVDGMIHDTALESLRTGVQIGFSGKTYQTKPCEAHAIKDPLLPGRTQKIRDHKHGPSSWISITLREGKFRQIRKMTAAVGFPTLRLIRVRIGNFSLEGMNSSEVRELSEQELQQA